MPRGMLAVYRTVYAGDSCVAPGTPRHAPAHVPGVNIVDRLATPWSLELSPGKVHVRDLARITSVVALGELLGFNVQAEPAAERTQTAASVVSF